MDNLLNFEDFKESSHYAGDPRQMISKYSSTC